MVAHFSHPILHLSVFYWYVYVTQVRVLFKISHNNLVQYDAWGRVDLGGGGGVSHDSESFLINILKYDCNAIIIVQNLKRARAISPVLNNFSRLD